MVAIWYPMTTPVISFEKMYLIVFLQVFGVYGIAAIVSLVLRRENQAVLATLIGFTPATFCGYGPSLLDAKGKYGFIMDLSYTRWGNEAFYTEELTPFRGIYQVDQISATTLGYTLDRVMFDFVMMFVLGCGLRVISLLVILHWNKHRQV
jgi:hypothetical protein